MPLNNTEAVRQLQAKFAGDLEIVSPSSNVVVPRPVEMVNRILCENQQTRQEVVQPCAVCADAFAISCQFDAIDQFIQSAGDNTPLHELWELVCYSDTPISVDTPTVALATIKEVSAGNAATSRYHAQTSHAMPQTNVFYSVGLNGTKLAMDLNTTFKLAVAARSRSVTHRSVHSFVNSSQLVPILLAVKKKTQPHRMLFEDIEHTVLNNAYEIVSAALHLWINQGDTQEGMRKMSAHFRAIYANFTHATITAAVNFVNGYGDAVKVPGQIFGPTSHPLPIDNGVIKFGVDMGGEMGGTMAPVFVTTPFDTCKLLFDCFRSDDASLAIVPAVDTNQVILTVTKDTALIAAAANIFVCPTIDTMGTLKKCCENSLHFTVYQNQTPAHQQETTSAAAGTIHSTTTAEKGVAVIQNLLFTCFSVQSTDVSVTRQNASEIVETYFLALPATNDPSLQVLQAKLSVFCSCRLSTNVIEIKQNTVHAKLPQTRQVSTDESLNLILENITKFQAAIVDFDPILNADRTIKGLLEELHTAFAELDKFLPAAPNYKDDHDIRRNTRLVEMELSARDVEVECVKGMYKRLVSILRPIQKRDMLEVLRSTEDMKTGFYKIIETFCQIDKRAPALQVNLTAAMESLTLLANRLELAVSSENYTRTQGWESICNYYLDWIDYYMNDCCNFSLDSTQSDYTLTAATTTNETANTVVPSRNVRWSELVYVFTSIEPPHKTASVRVASPENTALLAQNSAPLTTAAEVGGSPWYADVADTIASGVQMINQVVFEAADNSSEVTRDDHPNTDGVSWIETERTYHDEAAVVLAVATNFHQCGLDAFVQLIHVKMGPALAWSPAYAMRLIGCTVIDFWKKNITSFNTWAGQKRAAERKDDLQELNSKLSDLLCDDLIRIDANYPPSDNRETLLERALAELANSDDGFRAAQWALFLAMSNISVFNKPVAFVFNNDTLPGASTYIQTYANNLATIQAASWENLTITDALEKLFLVNDVEMVSVDVLTKAPRDMFNRMYNLKCPKSLFANNATVAFEHLNITGILQQVQQFPAKNPAEKDDLRLWAGHTGNFVATDGDVDRYITGYQLSAFANFVASYLAQHSPEALLNQFGLDSKMQLNQLLSGVALDATPPREFFLAKHLNIDYLSNFTTWVRPIYETPLIYLVPFAVLEASNAIRYRGTHIANGADHTGIFSFPVATLYKNDVANFRKYASTSLAEIASRPIFAPIFAFTPIHSFVMQFIDDVNTDATNLWRQHGKTLTAKFHQQQQEVEGDASRLQRRAKSSKRPRGTESYQDTREYETYCTVRGMTHPNANFETEFETIMRHQPTTTLTANISFQLNDVTQFVNNETTIPDESKPYISTLLQTSVNTYHTLGPMLILHLLCSITHLTAMQKDKLRVYIRNHHSTIFSTDQLVVLTNFENLDVTLKQIAAFADRNTTLYFNLADSQHTVYHAHTVRKGAEILEIFAPVLPFILLRNIFKHEQFFFTKPRRNTGFTTAQTWRYGYRVAQVLTYYGANQAMTLVARNLGGNQWHYNSHIDYRARVNVLIISVWVFFSYARSYAMRK